MTVLEVPFASRPLALGLLIVAVTVGVHLLLSVLLERRRVRWGSEYPAVLLGDPALALATALAATVAVPSGWTAGAFAGLLSLLLGSTYGTWQSLQEVREGRYTRAQVLGPSKLWHQYVVYPLVSHWVTAALISGFRGIDTAQDALLMVGASILVLGWVVTVVDAIRHPREGHGTWPHRATPTLAASQ